MPAEAGIQALKGIARLARVLNSYVRVAPPLHPGSLFFACPKKSDEKKGPPDGATSLCASRRNRRSPNSPGAEQRASGSNTRLAAPDSGCDARRRLRGYEKHQDGARHVMTGSQKTALIPNNP